jgi:hypothetical protein
MHSRLHSERRPPLSSHTAARREAELLGLGRRLEDGPQNLRQLIDHWLKVECDRRAFSTADNYRGYLRKWISPRWGENALTESKPWPSSNGWKLCP